MKLIIVWVLCSILDNGSTNLLEGRFGSRFIKGWSLECYNFIFQSLYSEIIVWVLCNILSFLITVAPTLWKADLEVGVGAGSSKDGVSNVTILSFSPCTLRSSFGCCVVFLITVAPAPTFWKADFGVGVGVGSPKDGVSNVTILSFSPCTLL